MKTKTEAAKILLDKGWTFEEVERVLGREQIVINPAPYVAPIPYPQPAPWIAPTPPYRPLEVWCKDPNGTAGNRLKFGTITHSETLS